MTFVPPSVAARPRRAEGPAPGWLDSPALAVTLGMGLVALMTLGKAVAVWRTGVFMGPDDAMRAVEVRDFLGGQGWFDLVPRRMAPGHPFAMHWSRLADLPLAGAMLAFGWFTDGATAERLTRLVEPALFYGLTLGLLVTLARSLCGPRGGLAVALLAAGGLDTIGDFLPGRIHHHALQVLLLVLMVKLVCDGLDPARRRRMAAAGAVAALSLGVNLQNMPFVAATAALLALVWALGQPQGGDPTRFGGGLLGGALAVFLIQVPPSRYLDGACDSFGAPHLLGAATCGLCFLVLGRLSPRLSGRAARCAALAGAGALCLLLLHAAYPACLGDPYAGVDPVIRTGWMAEVGEAMPLLRLLPRDPAGTAPVLLALLFGAGTTAAAAFAAEGLDRRRWIVLGGLMGVAILGTLWQVRVAASAEVLAALGGASLLCRFFAPGHGHDFGSNRSGPMMGCGAVAACPGRSRFQKAAGLLRVQGGALEEVHRRDGIRWGPNLFQGSALRPAKGRRPLETTGAHRLGPQDEPRSNISTRVDSLPVGRDVVRTPVPTSPRHAPRDAPPRRFGALLAVVAGLGLTPAGWTAADGWISPIVRRDAASPLAPGPADPSLCFEPSAYAGLAALPPGLVLSTIDPGAHILAHTAHSVIAGPYHRNGYGIGLALEVFVAPLDEARRIVTASGADYVALCVASPELRDILRDRPEGFASRVLRGEVPPWLTPIEGAGPFRLFAVAAR